MLDYTGWIVRAAAGRDRGGVFCVVGTDREQGSLLLADGKRRRAAKPKRKKLGHVEALTDHLSMFNHPVIEKLKQGQTVTDRELRRMLAAFRNEMEA